jgi:hypothetical protein
VRSLSTVCALLFAALLCALVVVSVRRPLYNWDMLPYVAVARSYFGGDPEQVHREVYDALRAAAPPEKVALLVGPDPVPYRADVAGDAKHFWEQVPFYSVKPLYPLLVAAVHGLGVNVVRASVWVAALAYAAACWLGFAWMARHQPAAVALIAATLLTVAPPFLLLARLSTPDSLYLLSFLGAGYLLVERRAPGAAMISLLIGMLARPNGILFYAMLGFYLTFLAPQPFRISVGACAGFAGASAALFLGLREISGNYPWTTFFYHSWIAYLPSPTTFVPALELRDYLEVYASHLLLFVSGEIPFFALVGMVALLARHRSAVPFREDVLSHVLLLIPPFMVVHWVLYPGQLDRMYAPQYFLIGLAAVVSVPVGPRPDGGSL